MNRLTKFHKACNQLIVVGAILLCLMAGFLLIEKEAPPLEKGRSFEALKEDFLKAARAYDIKSAKRLYAHLKEKNPYAPFVEQVAPAYLADVYIYYAQQMAFNAEAKEIFLTEARHLAPAHPLFSVPASFAKPEKKSALMEKTDALSAQIMETEKVTEAEITAYTEELYVLDETIEAVEIFQAEQEAKRLASVLTEVEMVEPPMPGLQPLMPLPEEEVRDGPPAAPIASTIAPQVPAILTDDACLLSYYTRNTPVSTCMDVLSVNQYGPALFVIGDDDRKPVAFTQQPITREAFNALCAETKQCSPEVLHISSKHDELGLDLSDVENTVQHYNAFCEISQTCSGLVSAMPPVLISEEKLPEYAKLLSKQTGYQYRVMTEADVQDISEYFNVCVAKELCEESLHEDLAKFLSAEKGKLLVRSM